MVAFPHKIITCRAVAPVLAQMLGDENPLTVLDVALHLQPDKLRQAILDSVASLEEDGATILMGYGLCGRGLEGVFSAKSTLVLPKVDDCVGMLLGSRARHQRVLSEYPGSYFMEPRWLENELNIFEEMKKGLDHVTPERRKQLLRVALKHYKRLVMLKGRGRIPREAERRCRMLAGEYEMEFTCMVQDLSLVDKLLHGPWDGPDFIKAAPGVPIPLF